MIATFSGEQVYSDYLKNRIKEAKVALNKTPILKILVDDFTSLSGSKRINNVVFWKCAWADGDHPDNISIADLDRLEGYLNRLDLLNWPQKKKDRIAAKMRSNTLSDSMAGYTEMTIAGYLAEKFGSDLVEYEPPLASGGLSDVKLFRDSQRVYIEVTALNTGETERKFDFQSSGRVCLVGDEQGECRTHRD